MEIFDTHTHLNTSEFEGRIQDELVQAQTFGVTRINNVGSNYELNDAALLLAEKFEECYATIGWHPDDAAEFDDQAENYLLTKLSAKKSYCSWRNWFGLSLDGPSERRTRTSF